MSSVGYTIRQAVKTILVAGVTDGKLSGIEASSIKTRMMTKYTKGIDRVPLVVISPYGAIGDMPVDFEGSRDRSFRVRIALIDSMQGDSETNDDRYSQWIEDAINLILVDDSGVWSGFCRDTFAQEPRVFQIRAEAVQTFNDSVMESGFYAFQNAVIRFDWQ